jgi:hypothetical protein
LYPWKAITPTTQEDREMISRDGKWHDEEKRRVAKLPSESLEYIIKDCSEAIYAMPDNPKNSQYADTSHYCAMELRKRRIGK